MKIRKRLQVLAFTFIALNLVEKAVLQFFLIMVHYVKRALRNRQQTTSPVVLFTFNLRPVYTRFNAEHFLRKIIETLKRSIFSFTIANLVNKGVLYFLITISA